MSEHRSRMVVIGHGRKKYDRTRGGGEGSNSLNDGAYSRYKVIDRKTGQEVRDAFVLTPYVDSAARTALAAYAEATRNVKVARKVRDLIRRIHDVRTSGRKSSRTGGTFEKNGNK